MPSLILTGFNAICASLGGFIVMFALVSYLIKEQFYISEALVSTVAGLVLSPHGFGLLKPLDYALGDQTVLDSVTLHIVRLVLGVQLIIAGVELPSRYLRREWRSLSWLLGPGMTGMWICTSLVFWVMVPHLGFLGALTIAACITPTDPVLSNSIVKGRFADRHISRDLQRLIVAESGANDGLGYPFLFLPLYILKYMGNGDRPLDGIGTVAKLWLGENWMYTIFLSAVYGGVTGLVAKALLHWAKRRGYVDRESFLLFAVALALFITGTVGMIGSDDVLACFIAGNTFTWDDWFRLETLDDSFQPVIDMLLNVTVFVWLGAVAPWADFAQNDVLSLWQLSLLGLIALLFRRLPVIVGMHRNIRQIETLQQALFVGFFGPIGVSAIFYLYVGLEFLSRVPANQPEQQEIKDLGEAMKLIVWFMAICSITVHGLSVPLGRLGLYVYQTVRISSRLSNENDERGATQGFLQKWFGSLRPSVSSDSLLPRALSKIGNVLFGVRDNQNQLLRDTTLPDASSYGVFT